MATIKIVRVLEYIGDEEWLRLTLDRGAIKENGVMVLPRGEIRELSRSIPEQIVVLTDQD